MLILSTCSEHCILHYALLIISLWLLLRIVNINLRAAIPLKIGLHSIVASISAVRKNRNVRLINNSKYLLKWCNRTVLPTYAARLEISSEGCLCWDVIGNMFTASAPHMPILLEVLMFQVLVLQVLVFREVLQVLVLREVLQVLVLREVLQVLV